MKRTTTTTTTGRGRLGLPVLYTVVVLQSFAQSGTQAVLALFCANYLDFSDSRSTLVVNLFMGVYNLFGPAGAVLSDYRLGNYMLQCYSTALWTLGALIMLLATIPAVLDLGAWVKLTTAFAGLALTAIGYGAINPVQSVLLADQFGPGEETAMIRSFSYFYLFCNIGNLGGELGGPVLREYVSFFSVFAAVAGAMLVSTALFVAAGGSYRKVPPKAWIPPPPPGGYGPAGPRNVSTLQGIWYSIRSLSHICKVFAPLPVFWALLYLQSSVWIFQGEQMSLALKGDVTIPPDIMPSLDDILCVVLIPILDYIAYPLYKRCTGRTLSLLGRMAGGMAAVSFANVLSGLLQLYIDSQPANSVTIAWQCIPYVFISLGEVMVAIPGLDYSYNAAPPAMKNVVTALWCLTQAAGSLLDAAIFSIPYISRARPPVFFGLAVLMAAFLAVFLVLTRNTPVVEASAASLDKVEPPPPCTSTVTAAALHAADPANATTPLLPSHRQ